MPRKTKSSIPVPVQIEDLATKKDVASLQASLDGYVARDQTEHAEIREQVKEIREEMQMSAKRGETDRTELKTEVQQVRADFGWVRSEIQVLAVANAEQTVMLKTIQLDIGKKEKQDEKTADVELAAKIASKANRRKIFLQIIGLIGAIITSGGLTLLIEYALKH